MGAACTSSTEGPVTWRIAIEEVPGSVQDRYAQRFKELVETRLDHKVSVRVFPYGTLGTSDELTEQLAGGVVQFAMGSPGHMGKFLPPLQVFLLHFLLPAESQVTRRVLTHPDVVAFLRDLYAPKGLRFLTAFSEGAMAWTANHPITAPSDFDGMKMRVMGSPLLIEAYEHYGASPALIAYSEVYSALQLSMIDGQVNPIFAIQEMSFYEVNDHIIFPGHAPFVTTFMANKEFFEDLPPESQEVIDGVVSELSRYILEVEERFNTERLDKIKQARPDISVLTLTPEQRDAFRKLTPPVHERFVELTGPLGEELLELVRRVSAEETIESPRNLEESGE